jgi:hypothetical protein
MSGLARRPNRLRLARGSCGQGAAPARARFATPGKALPVRENIAGGSFRHVVIFDGSNPESSSVTAYITMCYMCARQWPRPCFYGGT